MSTKRLAAVQGLWLLVWSLVVISPIGTALETGVARVVDFKARAINGELPPLSPRLKIFAYDDATAAELQASELTAGRWADLLNGMAERKARAVFVDAALGLKFSDERQLRRLTKAMKKVPVYGGAWWSQTSVPGLTPFQYQREAFDLRKLSTPRGEVGVPAPGWLKVHAGFLYGPNDGISEHLKDVGHLMRPNGWRVEPVLRVHERWAIPFAPLLLAKKLKIDDAGVFVDGRLVELDADAHMTPNLVETSDFQKRVRSLSSLFEGGRARVQASDVKSGDVVLLLPLSTVRRVQWRDTPLGLVPDGMIYAATLNSVLTGKWLTAVGSSELAGLAAATVAAVLGALLGAWLSARAAFWIFGAAMLGVPAAGVAGFVFAGMMTPWLTLSLVFVGAGALSATERARTRARRQMVQVASLKQHLPAERIPEFMSHVGVIGEATTEVVTVMFLDVVGFSVIAEDQRPVEVFGYLKEFSNDLRHVIYKHGGVVNKSLGDGLLAVFGLGAGSRQTSSEDALKCAIELQEICYARCVAASNSGRPLFPLRIGLNTAPVHVGNLGDGDFIDFTVVGDGVNLASRLESSADYFKIMLGMSVYQQLKTFDVKRQEFRKRLAKIKHKDDLIEAYEYDPFAARPEMISRLMDVYWRSIGISRAVPRDEVTLARTVAVQSSVARGTLRNYSRGGLGLELDRFLARGVILSLEIRDPALRQRLDQKAMGVVMVEVRWGRPSATGFTHGATFVGLSAEQKNFLFNAFKDAVGTRADIVAA